MEFRLGYTPISQFNKPIPLDPLVVSDHTEIILETPYGKICSWNISNPIYHTYFGSRETCSFALTQMYLDDDFIQNKIEGQLDSIVERLLSGQVDIQIIIEGYNLFFERLRKKLEGENFVVLYSEDFRSTTDSSLQPDQVNKTGIVVNLSKFTVKDTSFYTEEYVEPYDREPKRERFLGIPIVLLQPIGTEGTLIIGGIHVPGSNRRQPLKGLGYVNDVFQDLKELNLENLLGIVMMGDFNSIPKLVGENVRNAHIKLSPYPTHVNPSNQVSYYDMALVYGIPSAEILPMKATSLYTQALLESIQNCRQYLLQSQR
jgi:hypothetical protein